MNKFFAIAFVVAGLVTIGSAAHAEEVCNLRKLGRDGFVKCLNRQRWEHSHPEEAKKRAETPVVCSLRKMGRDGYVKCLNRQRYEHSHH